MHSLTATTALGGTEAQIDTIGGLTISECPDWAIASVAARKDCEKSLETAFKNAVGITLPKPSKSTTKDAFTVFWAGPNQYLVEAPLSGHELLANTLADSLQQTASVTEQTDGFVRFDLQGTGCSDVFERLCPLHTRTMATGTVSRTMLEHLGCFILRRADNHFSIYGPRSSAASLHHALITAAKSALG